MNKTMKQIAAIVFAVCVLSCVGCQSSGGGYSFWPFSSGRPGVERGLTDAEVKAVQSDRSFPTYQEVQMEAMRSGGTVLR